MTPEPSLTGVRLAIPDHAKGFPVLRALPLCTCCHHYPGAATGGPALLILPVISAFPGMAARSACASAFSRFAQCLLALRPAHSRCHRISWQALPKGFNHFVASIVAPGASGWSSSPGGAFTHRETPPLHGARHEPPVAYPPEHSSERPLESETCRKAYASNSALCGYPHNADEQLANKDRWSAFIDTIPKARKKINSKQVLPRAYWRRHIMSP